MKKLLLYAIISYISIHFLFDTEVFLFFPKSIQIISNIKHLLIFFPALLLVGLIKNKYLALIISGLIILSSLYKPILINFGKCKKPSNDFVGSKFRIGTFNLAGNQFQNLEIDKLILNENMDFVGFQEVPSSFLMSKDFENLKNTYKYYVYSKNDSKYWTQLILSKFELKDSTFLDPGIGFTTLHARISIKSNIEINDRKITIINNHLSIPFDRDQNCRGLKCLIFNYNQLDRDNQLNFLNNYISNNNGEFILIGDFNLSDQNYSYTQFSKNLIDSSVCTLNLNYTWSSEFIFPFTRLDYIFIKSNSNIYPISTKTIKIEGSDHLGVISDIGI